MQNAGLDDSQAGIKMARRNINNLSYTDDTTLMTENKEELKSLLLKTQHSKKKIMAFSPITSWQIDEATMENSERLFLGSKNHCKW